jgi:hypothetical protein
MAEPSTPLRTGPRRIRLSRAKGWRLPEGAVNVARPGRWGNPFIVGRDGTREQCVAMFGQLAVGFIDLGGRLPVDEQMTYYRRVRRSIGALEGRDLACWCALDGKPCHGDVLLALANRTQLPVWARTPIELPRVRLGISAVELNRLNLEKLRRERRHTGV